MATRPWVTPQEVRDYSEIKSVQERTEARLEVDIARAEQYIITYTHNTFEIEEEIPSSVKAAVIILTEAYARSSQRLAYSQRRSTTTLIQRQTAP